MIILGTNSIKDTGFNVANSCRFNSGSTDYLSRSLGASETSTRKATWSFWVKRSALGSHTIYFNEVENDNNRGYIQFNSDQLRMVDEAGSGTELKATQVFRDVSAWYHIVIAMDTTQSTSTDRVKWYVNGNQITIDATTTFPPQNTDQKILIGGQTNKNYIGRSYPSGGEFAGYFSEFVFIDGLQLDATSFGEFDSDSPTIWKPIDVSGLTFGTNGFYLDFEDSSALGNDVSGNNNDFTANNLTAIDQSTDTCTLNMATMNPLDNFYSANTFSESNTKIVTPTASSTFNTATFGLSSGKWYWEVNYSAKSNTNAAMIGISEVPTVSASVILGYSSNYKNVGYLGSNGNTYITGNGGSSYGNTYDVGDIIGVYLDLDNNKLYFSKNGTLQNSGTGVSITAPASTGTGVYFPALGDGGTPTTTSLTFLLNFGSPAYAISSSNTDDNGYGNFEYSPNITGDGAAKKFYTINTKNLAEFG